MTGWPSAHAIVCALRDQQRALNSLLDIAVAMLDKSAPDPFFDGPGPKIDRTPSREPPLAEGESRGTIVERPERRASGPSARPTVKHRLGGVTYETTARRADLVRALRAETLTAQQLVQRKFASSTDAIRKLIAGANKDLAEAEHQLRIAPMERLPRLGGRGGQLPPRYALINPNAPPGPSPAAQSEAAAGESPEQGSGMPAAEGACESAEPDQFVTQAATEEAFADAVDPAAAADDGIFQSPAGATVSGASEGDPPAAPRPPEPLGEKLYVSGRDKVLNLWANTDLSTTVIAKAALIQSGTVRSYLLDARREGDERAAVGDRRRQKPVDPIEPASSSSDSAALAEGDILAVDADGRGVTTRLGSYQIGGANLARTLRMLRHGEMFGLEHVARKCGWQSAEVARTALVLERGRLAGYGIDLYLDKVNVRLREAT